MSEQKTNRDGLIPGQQVDHETWARINNASRKKAPEQPKNSAVKPATKKSGE